MPTSGKESARVNLIDTNRKQVESRLDELIDVFEEQTGVKFDYIEKLIVENFRELNMSNVKNRCDHFGVNIKNCALLYSFYEFYQYLNLLVTTEIKYNKVRDKLRNAKQYIFEQKVDLGSTLLEQSSEQLASLNEITATKARKKLEVITLIVRHYSIESTFISTLEDKGDIDNPRLDYQKEKLNEILKKIQILHQEYEKKKDKLHNIKQKNARFK